MATANLNRWIGTANLTRDPEIKTVGSDLKVANMRIAVNSRVKREGEWQDKANYFDLVVFGAQVAAIERYLKRGSGIAVDGRLEYQEWEKDGVKHNRVVIIADSVQFTDGRRDDEAAGDGAPAGAPASSPTDDDDIPF